MPTENRSSNTEMVSPAPAPKQRIYVEVRECEGCNHIGIDDEHKTLGACHECDWSGPEPVEDKCPGCERENVMAAACPDCGSRYVLAASKEFEVPAPQPHPDPIAWMVGTAFWWTKEEAERDAAATGLPIVGLGPMTDPAEVERLRRACEAEFRSVEVLNEANQKLQAQLAEAQALLRDLDDAWNSHDGKERFAKLMQKVESLSASAEPSALAWACQLCQLEQPTDRPCDVCGGKTEPVATKP